MNITELMYDPQDIVAGESYKDWTKRWWKWILKIPLDTNPALDVTGAFGIRDQPTADVWFLAPFLHPSQLEVTQDQPTAF
jgi:hypothetical protein